MQGVFLIVFREHLYLPFQNLWSTCMRGQHPEADEVQMQELVWNWRIQPSVRWLVASVLSKTLPPQLHEPQLQTHYHMEKGEIMGTVLPL